MKPVDPALDRARRRFLRVTFASLATAALSACDRLSANDSFAGMLRSAQYLSRGAHKLVTGRLALAQELRKPTLPPRSAVTAPACPTVSAISNCVPVIAALGGVAFLCKAITIHHLISSTAILGGIALITLAPRATK